jgi:hypothetical protein
MSTKDQILSAALHGEALLAAKRPELQPMIDHLREVAQSRDDIRTECVGVMAGSWFADDARRGEELIAARRLSFDRTSSHSRHKTPAWKRQQRVRKVHRLLRPHRH